MQANLTDEKTVALLSVALDLNTVAGVSFSLVILVLHYYTAVRVRPYPFSGSTSANERSIGEWTIHATLGKLNSPPTRVSSITE